MTSHAAPTSGHNQTLAGRDPALKQTDPELVEYFDNFAFGDVVAHGDLDTRTRLMVQLAGLIACQAHTQYRTTLDAALANAVTPVEVKEIVYQSVPYVGIGKAMDFLTITNQVLTDRAVELPLPGQSTTTPDSRAERGIAIQKQIFGADLIDQLYATAPDDEQHIQRLLSENCFGDHYTRGGLDLPTRELLTFAMLVAHGGCDPQVRGHVAANRNVGNSRQLLIDVLTQLLPYIGYPRTLNGLRAIDDVAAAPEVAQ